MKSSPQLQRHIGLIALTLYGVGDILGAGVYGLIGKAAGQMGNAVWMAFTMSMVAAGLTGLSYASLGSRYPKAAGAAYATLRAFKSNFLSYVVGLALLASGLTSMAAAARVFAGYLTGFGVNLPIPVLVILFALLLAALVFRGIRESMWANAVCTVIELSGLLLIIVLGASALGSVDYMDTVTENNPSGELTISFLLSGAVLTFYSFIGFEDILNVAEEVKKPNRTVPLALIIAVLISSIIYILVSLISVSVVPAADLANSTQPLVDVMGQSAPWFPPKLFGLIAMFAVANTALLNFITASRLLYGMSNQKLLPKPLGHVHQKRSTPTIAIGTVLVIFLALALSGDVSSLAKATSVLLLLCFFVVNWSLVVLKRREKVAGEFKISSLIPISGSIACLLMLTQAKAPEWTTAGILLAAIGILYLIMRPKDVVLD
ncbi:MAG: APC family permease [Bdellovibrionales bacterium]